MKIGGIAKTTLLDYPGHVAATVFTAGCNFLCPFCYNRDLAENNIADSELISEDELFAFFAKRKNILSGICISGGEPTLQDDLADFIRRMKDLGYLVKLDTNGYRPDVIEMLLKEKLLDYIAIDIKGTIAKYPTLCGIEEIKIAELEKSFKLVKHSGINHEFRTTVIRELHTVDDLITIGQQLSGSEWYLQAYEENENVLKKGYTSYSDAELAEIIATLQQEKIAVKLR